MTEARVEILRRLARRGATPQLQRALKKSRPVDIAAAVGHLAPAEQRLLFQQLPTNEETAEVVFRLNNDDLHVIVKALPFERLVKLLDLMEADDEADVIDRLPEDMREKVLAAIQKEDKQLVEEILAWPEDSAGGIMQPIAFRLREDQTCRDAIAALHEQQEHLETIFYVYVENEGEQLVGVTSLRALLTHPPSTVLRDIMTLDVISVSPLDDQEDVARIASRYDLLAVPVVDENRHLLGIVTIDDVVDVIKEEALEDMMLMAGVGDAPAASSGSVISAARQRILWLGVTLLGGIGISEVVGLFHGALEQQAVLTGFIPVMLGTGGNVGTQAATVAVRNLALGNDADMGPVGDGFS
jgi:magnesium transporter